jgi:protein-tyrosine-phosphatase/DNA-binding transcriptional ArsR family regulator
MSVQSPILLKILANDLRWRLLHMLTRGDHRVQELADSVGEQQNLVSYHLRKLREAEVVHERRSSADARDVYYSANLDRLRVLYQAEGEALHPALGTTDTTWDSVASDVKERGDRGDDGETIPPARVLFLCTHNAARSQMAEGIMRHYGGKMVEVFSAGSEPSEVNPEARAAMEQLGIDISGQRSKHLREFLGQKFDYSITVCDRARESCPIFPGDPVQIHWSFPDPSAIEDAEERASTFNAIAIEMTTRIRYLITLIERDRKERMKAGVKRDA